MPAIHEATDYLIVDKEQAERNERLPKVFADRNAGVGC